MVHTRKYIDNIPTVKLVHLSQLLNAVPVSTYNKLSECQPVTLEAQIVNEQSEMLPTEIRILQPVHNYVRI